MPSAGRTEVGTDRGADPAAPVAGSVQGILTIEPGVKLFASGGSDYLLINRGSQIFAEGTATKPIIFTSRQNIEGTTNPSSQGQWGGIVIAGRAPTAVCPAGVTAPNALVRRSGRRHQRQLRRQHRRPTTRAACATCRSTIRASNCRRTTNCRP